jgi:transposase
MEKSSEGAVNFSQFMLTFLTLSETRMLRMLLRDDQWKWIEPLLQGKAGDRGGRGTNNRLFVEAVLWLARTGSPWRVCRASLVPGIASMSASRAGRTRTSGKTSSKCCAKTLILKRSTSTAPSCVRISTPLARQKKGHQALGRSRGGLTSRIHSCVEGLGQLVRFVITGGQVHDVTQAQALIETVEPEAVLADKAYDANPLLKCISDKQAKAVIPPRASRKVPRE